MILWFLLAFQPIDKFSINLGEYNENTIKVQLRDDGIFINDFSGLKLFDFNGELKHHIPTAKDGLQFISTFHVGPDFIWITDLVEYSSYFYDRTGNFLFRDEDLFARYLQDMGNDVYLITPGYIVDQEAQTSPFVHYFNQNREPFPRMIQIFKIKVSPTGVTGKSRIHSFYKAPKNVSEKRLQFKKVWAFEDNGTFTALNQVDNYSFVYSPAHLEQERKIPLGKPYSARTSPMNLPKFKEVPGPFQGKPFYKDTLDYSRDVLCWIWSQSVIVNVVPVPTGFVVGYLTPVEDCHFGHLVIAKLNRSFRFQTIIAEMDRYAILGEIHQDKIYVLVPNHKVEETAILSSAPEIWTFDLPQ